MRRKLTLGDEILLLFRMEVRRNEEKGELAFGQHMECSPVREIVDNALGCVGLQWSTNDYNDHTLAKTCIFEEDSMGSGKGIRI